MVKRDAVEQLAYTLYEASGRGDGHDLDHWLEAERMLREGAKTESHDESGVFANDQA